MHIASSDKRQVLPLFMQLGMCGSSPACVAYGLTRALETSTSSPGPPPSSLILVG